ncbi:MAG: type II secretion system protein GspM [Syntrophomonadaceae bacterium]|nr:type II secretion system protein GspM [Syntrophomonadaceae bacterium]
MIMTRRERALLLLAGCALVAFISWRFLVEPVLTEHDALRERHALMQQQLQAAIANPAATGEQPGNSAVLTLLPAHREIDAVLTALGQAAELSGCFIHELKIYDDEGTGDAAGLPALIIEAEVGGSNEALLQWVREMETGARLLRLSDVKWAEEDGAVRAATRWRAWYGDRRDTYEGW